MLKFIVLLAALISSNLIACDNIKKYEDDKILSWLGDNSQFSKNILNVKCLLDEELEGYSPAKRKVIAKLILKTYEFDNKEIENLIY